MLDEKRTFMFHKLIDRLCEIESDIDVCPLCEAEYSTDDGELAHTDECPFLLALTLAEPEDYDE